MPNDKDEQKSNAPTPQAQSGGSNKPADGNVVAQAKQIASAQPNQYATQEAGNSDQEVPLTEGKPGGVYVVGNKVLNADGIPVKNKD